MVAFTSQASEEEWDELFDDYLIKPFGFDDLHEIVDKFLGPVKTETI